ncbi:MAG: hypothetical protein Q9171_006912 [Xanthocarpia ochracea]
MAYPQPTPTPQTSSYDPPTYANHLTYLEKLILEYRTFINYPDTCPTNPSTTEPCQGCIEETLKYMAETLSYLLSAAPSPDIVTEYEDLQKLSRLSKGMLEVEGPMGHWVYVLIDQKCQSLEGLMLEMSRRGWRDEGCVSGDGRGRGRDLREGRVPPAVRTVANVPISNSPALNLPGLGSVADGQGYDEDIDMLSSTSDSTLSTIEVITDPYPPTSNGLGYDASEPPPTNNNDQYPATPSKENRTDGNKYEEDAIPPPTYFQMLEFDVLEGYSKEVEVPIPPGPAKIIARKENDTTATVTPGSTQQTIDENASSTLRRLTGMEFNIVEKEPGEVRAPAPPRPRKRRRRG